MATIIKIKSNKAEKLHEHATKALMCMKKLVKCLDEYMPLDDDEDYDERDDDDMGYQDDDDNNMKANRRRGNQGGSQGAGRYGRERY